MHSEALGKEAISYFIKQNPRNCKFNCTFLKTNLLQGDIRKVQRVSLKRDSFSSRNNKEG
jgi:hypothetical protein